MNQDDLFYTHVEESHQRLIADPNLVEFSVTVGFLEHSDKIMEVKSFRDTSTTQIAFGFPKNSEIR